MMARAQSDSGFSDVLVIHAISGTDIAIKDITGTSDPYVFAEANGDAKASASTKVVWKNLNPVWNETIVLPLKSSTVIQLTVMDKDLISRDDFCGSVTVDLTQLLGLVTGAKVELELRLFPQGKIKIALALKTPTLLAKCINFIAARGLELEGIYRVSANEREVKDLHDKLDENPFTEFGEVDNSAAVNNVAALLKRYLRELPEELIPDRCLPKLLAATGTASKSEQKALVTEAFSEQYVNASQAWMIRTLFLHFKEITNHSDKNKMDVKNLAVCTLPSLLNKSHSDHMPDENIVNLVKFLIDRAPQLF